MFYKLRLVTRTLHCAHFEAIIKYWSNEVTHLNIDICRQLRLTSPIKFETDFTLIEEYWRCGYHGQHSVQSIVGSNLEIVNFNVKYMYILHKEFKNNFYEHKI